MKALRNFLDQQHKHFAKGGKLEKLYPLYEAIDTFAYTPGETTSGSVHVRDALDLKRLMITVAMALFPCVLMALYNTGYQSNLALESMEASTIAGWRGDLFSALGMSIDSSNLLSNVVHGALYFLPIFLVTQIAGGFWEVLFASVRKHEVNEGFLVTGLLFPLILPATIPLWQVAIGISFGVVVGKEIFGGTGKNFLNIALLSRAYLYFAYPAQISGDLVWVAADGYSGATALAVASNGGLDALTESFSFMNSFWGFIPGSMGETSTFAALLGAAYLLLTGIGSWRIMSSVVAGVVGLTLLLNFVGSDTNPFFNVGPLWHFVIGGLAFGLVFMATDPVSASMTTKGQYFYGLLIGCMTVLIRVINPAFPEGIMLAILFGNVFAPLIDYFVIRANIKRRELRNV
jgi:Na+-transporting NADH:ubiquinone oxidoreductase subunit B